MKFFRTFIAFVFPSYQPIRSTTVRYAFPLVFAVAAFLTATSLVSVEKSFVHLESSVRSVHAGDTFSIDVYVAAHVPVNAVDLTLAFPKDQIRVLGIDTGASVITLWTEEPSVKGNTVVMRGGTFRKGFLGDHLIATINAKAIETGTAEFRIDTVTLLAGDGSGSRVSVSKTGQEEKTLFISTPEGQKATTEAIGIKGAVAVLILTDIDGDGNVSLSDISRFMVSWQKRDTTYDFNGDGQMTFRDFGIILADSFIK